ncbi:MAG: GNAT family N-acetyltransferase [Cyclobacteriaceae bacterium]|nr:GNAT family N-acetyltransferase [Cyclobacteriaceae bacterium]
MHATLETERLSIRPLNLTDTEFIISLLNSDGWIQHIGNRNVSTPDDAQKFIDTILNSSTTFYNVFELRGQHKPIGIVTLKLRETQPFPDIGFALLPEFEGYGYALEASTKYLAEVVRSGKYKNILGITLPDNKRSINLLKKLGLAHHSDFTENNTALSLYALHNL